VRKIVVWRCVEEEEPKWLEGWCITLNKLQGHVEIVIKHQNDRDIECFYLNELIEV